MLTLALIGSALATSPVEDVRSRLEQPSPPSMIMTCKPVGGISDYVARLPALKMLHAKSGPKPDDPDAEVARFMWSLLEPGGLQAAGFDPEGAVSFVAWGDLANKDSAGMHISVPFQGNAAQQQRLVGLMGEDAPVIPEGDTWEVATKEDKGTGVLQRDASGIHFRGGSKLDSSGKADLRLIDGLPSLPGCVMYFYKEDGFLPQKPGSKPDAVAVTGGMIFMPLDTGDARIRVLTTLQTPALLSQGGKVEALGRSTLRPTGTGVVSVDLLDLARKLIEWAPDDMPNAKEIKSLDLNPEKIPIQIPPGTQFAVYASPPSPYNPKPENGFVAVFPVQTKKGRPVPAKKILSGVQQMLEGFKGKAEPHEAGGLKARMGKNTVRIHATKGLLVVGTIDSVVEDVVAGRGEPWVSKKLIERAESFPIAGDFQYGVEPPILAETGIRVDDGMIEFAFGMSLAGQETTGAGVVGMLAAIAIPNFVEMQYRAKRAEVPSNVAGIQTALLAYDAAFDTFVAAPAHPRPVSALNKKQAEWPEGSPFDTLGWGPDGKVRGTYWIEVSEDGTDFKVTGAIDVDGDGVPAIFTATRHYNTTMQTPATVY